MFTDSSSEKAPGNEGPSGSTAKPTKTLREIALELRADLRAVAGREFEVSRKVVELAANWDQHFREEAAGEAFGRWIKRETGKPASMVREPPQGSRATRQVVRSDLVSGRHLDRQRPHGRRA